NRGISRAKSNGRVVALLVGCVLVVVAPPRLRSPGVSNSRRSAAVVDRAIPGGVGLLPSELAIRKSSVSTSRNDNGSNRACTSRGALKQTIVPFSFHLYCSRSLSAFT